MSDDHKDLANHLFAVATGMLENAVETTAKGQSARLTLVQVIDDTSETNRRIGLTRPRAETNSDKVVNLLRLKNDTAIADVEEATEWQAHSVRGFLGTAKKWMGHNIQCESDSKGM